MKGMSKKRPNVGRFHKQYPYQIPTEQYMNAIILFVNVFLTGVWVSDSKISMGVLEFSK